MSDRQALFKAAKAQRGTTALTKDQIKALKLQKAKAAAEASAAAKEAAEKERKHEAALKMASATAARQRDAARPPKPSTSGAMPPPAPRQPSATATASAGPGSMGSNPAPLERRSESQMTNVGRIASIAPEPAGQSNASSGAVHGAHDSGGGHPGEEHSIGSLPAGFFDGPSDSGGRQESVGTGELVGSNLDVNSEVASALLRGSSIEAMSARTQGLPADFFEAGDSNEGDAQPTAVPSKGAAGAVQKDKPGALPTGFFENKEEDAKAHGIAPEKKLTKEETYADFMNTIAADVREVEAREQDEAVDAAQERADREAFEQRARLERIMLLKGGQTVLPGNLPQSEATAPRLEASLLPKPRKRKLAEIKEEDESDLSGSDDEDELDWRAKAL